jgi:cold shock CspA family protein
MTYGTVTWFDPQRGVGAVTIEETGVEVAVRSAQIDGGGQQSLQKDHRVVLTLVDGPSGPQVANIYVP